MEGSWAPVMYGGPSSRRLSSCHTTPRCSLSVCSRWYSDKSSSRNKDAEALSWWGWRCWWPRWGPLICGYPGTGRACYLSPTDVSRGVWLLLVHQVASQFEKFILISLSCIFKGFFFFAIFSLIKLWPKQEFSTQVLIYFWISEINTGSNFYIQGQKYAYTTPNIWLNVT